jgi:SHS2 domain-containing protein
MFELFEHTADLGLRVRAPDLDSLFREAAEGLFSMIVESWSAERATREFEFELQATRHDDLLFDWLNELLYTFDTTRCLLGRFELNVSDTKLVARAWGTPLDLSEHSLLHEVKAITYHGLLVEPTDGGWLAEVIVDI